MYTRAILGVVSRQFSWNFPAGQRHQSAARCAQVRIKEGAMGDAAMNVAASGGGGQRVVKEGWLQKRGTTEQSHNIYVRLAPLLRSEAPNPSPSD